MRRSAADCAPCQRLPTLRGSLWINDPSRVFIARNGRHELTNVILSRAEVQELVERMLKSSGRRIDLSQPFVDAMLPQAARFLEAAVLAGQNIVVAGGTQTGKTTMRIAWPPRSRAATGSSPPRRSSS